MTTDIVLERVLENLEETYLAVGAQGEGAWIDRWEGGSVCLSSLNHPVSNFAVVRSAAREDGMRLRELAIGRRAFNSYVLPGPNQATVIRLLKSCGFCEAGRLLGMVGEALESAGAELEVRAARTFDERMDISRFMARQFFTGQTSSVRESIALATAKAPVELIRGPQKDLICAAMVSRTSGAIGIYNLCVSASERERGYGSELLAEIGRLAGRERALATLQCEPSLEPWYSRRGFGSIGSITVLTLDGKASHAII